MGGEQSSCPAGPACLVYNVATSQSYFDIMRLKLVVTCNVMGACQPHSVDICAGYAHLTLLNTFGFAS